MKLFLAFVLIIVNGGYSNRVIGMNKQTIQSVASSTSGSRDAFDKTLQLIEKLAPTETTKGNNTTIRPASQAKVEDISRKIVALASESTDSRAQVIQALSRVIDDSSVKRELVIANRWLAAVKLLERLNAVEAVDVLLKNITETGQNGIIVSMHFRPVAQALINLGKPAVPKLIEALADDSPEVRHEVADVLATIYFDGQFVFRPASYRNLNSDKAHFANAESIYSQLIDVLEGNRSSLKGGAALALAWICTDESRDAIDAAIQREKDEKILNELKSARAEMKRFCGK